MRVTSNSAYKQRPLAVHWLPAPLLMCTNGNRMSTCNGCAVQRGVAYERIVGADAQHVLHSVLLPATHKSHNCAQFVREFPASTLPACTA